MGFKDGDKILKVDGKVQNDMDKLALDVLLSDNVTVLRNGSELPSLLMMKGKQWFSKRER
ncbi:hypothetical protein BPO_1556 [Bergeyella porcorum]|uniref:PDZ domain-containing protein n=1 Tax=Bergeyella porcorum TaxID=1735111 RepID=A0AAU0F5Z4_9FLAO